MAFVLTCIAVLAAIPAVFASDDEISAALGLNALLWAGAGQAASILIVIAERG